MSGGEEEVFKFGMDTSRFSTGGAGGDVILPMSAGKRALDCKGGRRVSTDRKLESFWSLAENISDR